MRVSKPSSGNLLPPSPVHILAAGSTNVHYMRKLTQNIVIVPIVLFLIGVLSAPMLTIHHVHLVETTEHAEHHQSSAGLAITEVPATYHETHVVTFLSGDSFNASTSINVVPTLHKFIATLAVVPMMSSTLSTSHIASIDIRPLPQLSRDKCVLFCSFLI